MYDNVNRIGNGKQAAAWRAELMRQLYPQKALSWETPEREQAIATTKRDTEDAIKKALADRMNEFLSLAGPFMSVNNTSSNRLEALKKIFNDTGSLSLQLWSQLRHFEVIDLKSLPEHVGEAKSSIPDMPFVDAHPMHMAALEDDERCMDEKN